MTGEKAIRIAITGPESTGKSDLAEKLALHFQGRMVREYAREYLNNLRRPYQYTDILNIAKKQQQQIRKAINASTSGFIFFDTEMTVLRIWCMFSYGRCFPWILKQQEEQSFDLYLLMAPDLPWVPDPLREHPHQREKLFELYAGLLKQQSRPFEVVRGLGQQRLNNAIQIIEKRF